MSKHQIIVAWNREAAIYAEEHGIQAAYEKSCDVTDNAVNDWTVSVYTFDTHEEAAAFCLGCAEAQGWDSPYWEEIEEINE